MLTPSASVLALVPHYRCEEWLDDCLASLASQTRQLEGIVVIDDGSKAPPERIVARYPDVTLLASSSNVGPYRLVQQVIDDTEFDAYLFQDADDWSHPERLATLLAAAEEHGADLVGSQEVRVLCEQGDVVARHYPLDVNAALRERPGTYAMLHPATLVSRDLVTRTGGFATGLRFSGDLEFLQRATHLARLRNVPAYCYFRRKRAGALTTAAATGLGSQARERLHRRITERARANAARARSATPPMLEPMAVAGPLSLVRVSGPDLGTRVRRGSRRATAAGNAQDGRGRERGRRPVFAVGAPASGAELLAWSLAQHPRFRAAPRAQWLTPLVRGLAAAAAQVDQHPAADIASGDLLHTFASAAAAVAAGGKRWADGDPSYSLVIPGLLSLWPDARFIHVVRDAGESVTALLTTSRADDTCYSEETVSEHWQRCVDACVAAEAAYGQGVVLRVSYHDLRGAPETVLRHCLEFLDEPYDPACARPVRALARDPKGTGGGQGPRTDGQRAAGSLTLPSGSTLSRRGDPAAAQELERAFVRTAEWGPGDGTGGSVSRRAREVARMAIPAGGAVAVVSRGDDRLLDLGGDRRAEHFPATPDGRYAGHHPGTSAEAVSELEAARRRGAEFLVVPGTAFWWLEHYSEFAAHLQRTCRLVAYHEDTCAVYRLQPTQGRSAHRGIAP